MSPARSPRPNRKDSRKNPVRDAFLSVALPELPDGGAASAVDATGAAGAGASTGTAGNAGTAGTAGTAAAGRRPRHLSDHAMTCPDGLVEEVLWGLLHGLTAPVIAGGPGRGTVHGAARGGRRA